MSLLIQKPLYLLALLLLPALVLLFRLLAPRPPGRRRTAALVLRCLTVALLAFSLGRAGLAVEIDRVNALFLLDVSESVDSFSRRRAEELIRSSWRSLGRSDTAGLIVFAQEASVDLAPRPQPGEPHLESQVSGSATDIARAIQIALASFPDQGRNRIVLLSDGNETRGRARDAARVARASGVEIFSVALGSAPVGNEVLIEDMLCPRQTRAGQVHEVTVRLSSRRPADALLTIWKDGAYAGEQTLQLRSGENSYSFSSSFQSSGLHHYQVLLEADDDLIPENNRFESFITVRGAPSILYLCQRGKQSAALLGALRTQGIQAVLRSVEGLPGTLAGLLGFDAVILDNVPAFDLSFSAMELLERYVRDAAGGLLMIGGEQSFGLGGYYRTPVERILPVDVDVASSARVPSLTMVFLIDKSGSMGGYTAGGQTKLELVQRAVLSAVDLLNPYYQVALLAFDADTSWTVALTPAGARNRIAADLMALSAGGGTDLYRAMQEGQALLAATGSAVKHLLVLSDGLTEKRDFEALCREIAAGKITVSTVGVGEDADRRLLEQIALWGGGRSYFTNRIEDVPRIFASETIVVSRGLINEEPFLPQVREQHEILGGLDPLAFPPLEGYILTYPKSGARQILATGDGQPLLAVQRHGLGRSAAFTSDLAGRWSAELLSWEGFPRLAAQLLRWLQKPASSGRLNVELERAEGRGAVRVSALDEERRFINLLNLQAAVLDEAGVLQERDLEQVAPGEYRAVFEAEEPGAYLVTIFGDDGLKPIAPETAGLIVPYPREYRSFEPNISLLQELAEISGGRLLEAEEEALEAVFDRTDGGARQIRELGPGLMLAALVLLVLEIALRRMPPGWFCRLMARLRVGLRRLPVQPRGGQRPGPPQPDYDELSRLIVSRHEEKARERARRGLDFWFSRAGRRR